MKKLAMTIAIVLSMGLSAFAQQGEGLLMRSESRSGRDNTTPLIPNGYGQEDADANQTTPVGSGIAVLVGLGAAYLVGKKRREE